MPKLANLDKKQLTVVVVLVIVLGVLAWQVYGLIAPSDIETPEPTIAKPAAPAVTPTTPALHLPAASATNPASELQLDPNQKKYLSLIEEYKLVELQKLIATDKQAIAAAQASTAESINRINQLGGQASLQDLNNDAGTDTTTDKKDVAYNLVYTGLQDGSWTATLKQGNNVYDVMKGTVLDGKYNVTDINNDRVLLKSKDEQLTISFDGSVTTPIATEAADEKNATPSMVTPTAATIKSETSTQGLVQNPPMPAASVKIAANEAVTTPTPLKIATHAAPVAPPSAPEKTMVNLAPATAAPSPSPVAKPAAASLVAGPSLATTTFIPIPESTEAPAPTPTTSVVKTLSETVKKEEKKIFGATAPSTAPSQPEESPWYKKTWDSIKTWAGQKTPPEQQAAETLPPLMPHKATAHNNPTTVTSPAVTTPVMVTHQELAAKPEAKPIEVLSTPAVTPFSLATANPAHYTLQVATFETKQKMDTFVTSYLKNRSDYFIYQNKNRHQVLVLGDYATRADAAAALEVLPKSLQDGKPYPVSIESAQSKMVTTDPLAS